jgi:signal transduction histidine kinase
MAEPLTLDNGLGGGRRRRIAWVLTKAETFPGPVSLGRLFGRVGLAAFSVLVVVGLVIRVGDEPVQAGVGAGVALAAAAPLFLGRPQFMLGYAVAATVGVVLLGNGDPRTVVWFALVVLAAWCVLAGGVVVGVSYWVGAVLLFGAEWLWALRDPGWAPWTGGVTLSVLAALLIRHELVLVERLRAAQADLAARTRVDERSRIARELHDIIAHSLTVSLLHITSARLAVEHDPADAARALAEAERLGRQSLAEVRATMGLLRSDGGEGRSPGVAPPVPSLDEVPTLVEELSRAGADVCLILNGELHELPATVGSTIYRIVQEALTNAIKHASGAAVTVRIDAEQDVDVRIDSDGRPGHGTGMGVANMAERAQAVGGTCTAGPGGSGWLVHATLPLLGARDSGRE